MHIQDDTDLMGWLDGPVVQAATTPLTKIHDGVADYSLTFQLINRSTNASTHSSIGFKAGHWFETTEDIYWYFLEVLPPMHMGPSGFVMSECTVGNLYHAFADFNGRYFCLVVDWQGQQTFKALLSQLRLEVRS